MTAANVDTKKIREAMSEARKRITDDGWMAVNLRTLESLCDIYESNEGMSMEWISVEDRLPDDGELVLIWALDKHGDPLGSGYEFDFIEDDGWVRLEDWKQDMESVGGSPDYTVTHWAALNPPNTDTAG